MVAASLSATLARSYAVSVTLLALAARPTPPVSRQHARESQHWSRHPRRPLQLPEPGEPTEPPPWLRASRVARVDPRWLSSHLIQRIGNVARFSNLAIAIRLSAFLGRFQEPTQFRDPVCERLSVLVSFGGCRGRGGRGSGR